MQWEFLVALVVAIPIILFPVAFVWYLNIGSVFTLVKKARVARAARKKVAEETAETRSQP